MKAGYKALALVALLADLGIAAAMPPVRDAPAIGLGA